MNLNKLEIREYLKENLSIGITTEYKREIDEDHNEVRIRPKLVVSLYLEGDLISSDYIGMSSEVFNV